MHRGKVFLIVCLVLTSMDAFGANVVWNVVEYSNGQLNWKSEGGNYWLNTSVTYATNGEDWRLTPTGAFLEFYGATYLDDFGKTIDAASVSSANKYFSANPNSIGGVVEWNCIEGAGPCEFYLSFVLYDNFSVSGFSDNPIYGWVKLYAGDELIVESSAIDLAGGSMVVGDGGSATPEPTSLLLLFVGVAGLALRRRGCGAGREF